MKELKIGDSFLFAEDLWEVTEILPTTYAAKILLKPGTTTMVIDKRNPCFIIMETTTTKVDRHIHSMALYQGFTDIYSYCTSCNYKEKI